MFVVFLCVFLCVWVCLFWFGFGIMRGVFCGVWIFVGCVFLFFGFDLLGLGFEVSAFEGLIWPIRSFWVVLACCLRCTALVDGNVESVLFSLY